MQILILHKLFPPRSNDLYLLETHCNYKFQCQFLINKETYHEFLLLVIKDIVKASTNIFLYPHGLLIESGCPRFLSQYNLLVKLLPHRTPEVVAFKWLVK